MADAGEAILGVPFGIGFGYFFTNRIKPIVAEVHRVERWLSLAGPVVGAAALIVGV